MAKIVKVLPQQLDFPIIMDRTVERFCKKFRQGRIPRIDVQYVNRSGSSGKAWPFTGYMKIHVGTSPQDAEHVLLHELTHLIGDHYHGPVFYRNFKKVITWAGVDRAYSENREANYKPRNAKKMMRRSN